MSKNHFILLWFTCLFSRIVTAQSGGQIQGIALVGPGAPAVHFSVFVRSPNAKDPTRTVQTLSDGSYQVDGLTPGIFELQISDSQHFYTHPIVVDLQVVADEVLTVPPIVLSLAGIYYCPVVPAPDYLRVERRPTPGGSLGGIVRNEENVPIAGAVVSLYRLGGGLEATVRTDSTGYFTFAAVPIRADKYLTRITANGYFSTELTKFEFQSGFESVYSGIKLEPCPRDHCQPHLKTIRILPQCA